MSAIQVDTSIGGSTVADLLATHSEQRGHPAIITTNHGPGFICHAQMYLANTEQG